ncbi:MAG: hypothetical protein H6944_17735 [Zoogloeaceae bacterium]|uniref:T6SS immunity protein Tli3 family protein n=1 Tax=Denitromonas sp. TaxID=2734609 RepID=UPI002C94FE16|nr:hypothetical protein [Zoogloeaceae bacterium]HPR08560.1 hypothetical protein [Denitromonas sp.]HQU90167.1 hypothetical protein [Denitromonas sp.]
MWLIPLWTLGLALACFMFGQWMGKKPTRLLATGLSAVALIPWLPSSHAEAPRKPSTQIVYRFDDHRYLTLTGYGCEGAINYVDEKRDINTPMIDQFARVFLPRIIHADNDGDFIFIPYHEPSAFRVSKDHGKTFQDARWVGGGFFCRSHQSHHRRQSAGLHRVQGRAGFHDVETVWGWLGHASG